jgi:hypothetical protein
MTEKFYFDFHQIPHVGVDEPDLDAQTRTDVKVPIRRPSDMKISNFGSMSVGLRMSSDYTRTQLGFKAKDDLSDVNVITEDKGMGSNVRLFGVTVDHNPYIWGDSIKLTRDDQFIRMTMSKEGGTSTAATEVDPPKFDVMDTKEVTAAGINNATNGTIKNWPSEGWRSFGGKYDFLPYDGVLR